MPTDPCEPEGRDRRVGIGEPPLRNDARGRRRRRRNPGRGARYRAWGTRCSTRSSFRWRTRTRGTTSARHGQGVREVRRRPGARRAATGPVPGRLPQPGRLHEGTSRPRSDPADRIPSGVIPGFQNFTGTAPADMLRLNMAIPPVNSPNRSGILGGDLAGFPNGRRPQDDVVASSCGRSPGRRSPAWIPASHPTRRLRSSRMGPRRATIPLLSRARSLPRLARGRVRQHPSRRRVSWAVVTVARAGTSPKGSGPLDGPGAHDGLMLDIGADTGALVPRR